jgi:hypothetical protein
MVVCIGIAVLNPLMSAPDDRRRAPARAGIIGERTDTFFVGSENRF